MHADNKPTTEEIDLTYFRNRLSLNLIKLNQAIEESRQASATVTDPCVLFCRPCVEERSRS